MLNPAELKVCFLTGTLGRGGAERQLLYMLRALQHAGIPTRVLSLTRGEAYEAEIESLGMTVEWIGSSGLRSVRLGRVIKSLHRRPADILQSAHFFTNLYAAAAGRLLGVKSIGAIRGDLNREMAMNGVFGRAQLFAPGHLIANSSLAVAQAQKLGVRPGKIDFIHNAVDCDLFNSGSNGGSGCGPLNILFAGRLTEEKRPDRFLRVVARVVASQPARQIKACVAGAGPLRPSLEALANGLGLGPDRLEFIGEQPCMESVYRKTDLLMLTSDSEGTPNVLLEAMAHGIPVAATCVGGVKEIVRDCGFIVAKNDEGGLAAAALRLASDPRLRCQMGRRGREYVKRFHSLTSLREQLLCIYRRVLSA